MVLSLFEPLKFNYILFEPESSYSRYGIAWKEHFNFAERKFCFFGALRVNSLVTPNLAVLECFTKWLGWKQEDQPEVLSCAANKTWTS